MYIKLEIRFLQNQKAETPEGAKIPPSLLPMPIFANTNFISWLLTLLQTTLFCISIPYQTCFTLRQMQI